MADFEFKAPATQRPVVRYVITGVIVLILLAILIWAIVHHYRKVSTPPSKSPSTSQNSGAGQGSGSSGNSSSGSASVGSNSGSSSSNSGSSSQNSSGSNASGSQLTDTGPGDDVALFIGAALAGGLGYQLYLRRRLARGR